MNKLPPVERVAFVDEVARRNALQVVHRICHESETVRRLVNEGRIAVVGVLYDVSTGKMDFMIDEAIAVTVKVVAALRVSISRRFWVLVFAD